MNQPEIVPAKAAIERQDGNVYVSYSQNIIGEKMPCVFALRHRQKAYVELVKEVNNIDILVLL